ncbi:hypothetical protein [Spiroplasma sp. BIUS-1]|uniref:hypothetical protein n=1 Tax=Spiroplasma sp. BIUS-1 TaxID=216964 RepID=UPI0013993CD1|nr:hypothetical protein [Spiroplasma sp. BIUS-1]QHX36758.1 hypothetical protein SBIUS_v1c05050 [Spiroplasma sp. BIUS-1]
MGFINDIKNKKAFKAELKYRNEKLIKYMDRDVWFGNEGLFACMFVCKPNFIYSLEKEELMEILSARVLKFFQTDLDEDQTKFFELCFNTIKRLLENAEISDDTLVWVFPTDNFIEMESLCLLTSVDTSKSFNFVSVNYNYAEDREELKPLMGSNLQNHPYPIFMNKAEKIVRYVYAMEKSKRKIIWNGFCFTFLDEEKAPYLFDSKFNNYFNEVDQTDMVHVFFENNESDFEDLISQTFNDVDPKRTQKWLKKNLKQTKEIFVK